jgi:oxygen-independent coproporphyrinogen-3 oxidase
MKFGVYVHIPYCIQRCRYCDFTTFEQNSIMPPEDYVELLVSEIQTRSKSLASIELESVYFGGGTPSLLNPKYIDKILQTLDACGLHSSNSTEVTIEINPATINLQKLDNYKKMGINRFSLGVQTFSDSLLKACGREHNSQQTKETLELLSGHTSNFSLDILYALPGQTLDQVAKDLDIALSYQPHHVSAYCLTLPQGHPMNQNRPEDDIQMSMLDLITERLNSNQWKQYEISNFSIPKFESRHNLLYWQDQAYWGIGLSAHSSFPKTPDNKDSLKASTPNDGFDIANKMNLNDSMMSSPYQIDKSLRFWNPKEFKTYISQLRDQKNSTANFGYPFEALKPQQVERLQDWETLTDFCHISLRLNSGLSKEALRYRYSHPLCDLISSRLKKSVEQGWVNESNLGWTLTREGQKMSNQIFLDTTFLSDDFE